MSSPLAPFLILALVGVFTYAIWRPWICFTLVLVFPVIEQSIQSYIPFFQNPANFSLLNFVIAGLVGITVSVRFFNSPESFRYFLNPVFILAFALQLFSYVSLVWTPEYENGFLLSLANYPYAILYIIFTPLLLSSLDDFRRVRLPITLIGTVALIFFFFGPTVRLLGTRLVSYITSNEYSNPLVLARVGVTVLVSALLTRTEGLAKWVTPALLGAGIFGLGMAILSGSRGQVVLGVLVVGVLYPFAREIKDIKNFFSLFFGLFVIFGLIYMAASVFITGDNLERWSGDSLTGGAAGRLELVMDTFTPWLNSPSAWLFGNGAGAFITLGFSDKYPHNQPIEVLTELGLVGFSIYLAMLFFSVKYSVELFRLSADSTDHRSSATILIGIALFGFLLTLKQGTVHNSGVDMMVFIVIARLALFERNVLDEDEAYGDEHEDEYEDDEAHEFDDEEDTDDTAPETSFSY